MMMPDDHHHQLSFPSYVLHQEHITPNPNPNPNPTSSNSAKRKRNLPGNPDPDAEVIALSPNSLMATNRFICEICNKGFKRDQNLQLHRRGHNLPWKLKQRTNKDQIKKKVYICPEKTCVHHDPGRALGDLTGIKKHFSRKHGEKKWKCDKCSKKYAVMSDWKAHSKICGTREYRCDCGTLFSRKDSFITHRAFCDALAEESARFVSVPPAAASATPAYLHNAPDAEVNLGNINENHQHGHTTSSQLDQPVFNNQRQTFLGQTFTDQLPIQPNVFASPSTRSASDSLQNLWHLQGQSSHQWLLNENNNNNILQRGISKNEEEHEIKKVATSGSLFSSEAHNNANNYSQNGGQIASMSATALLQKAAQMGSKRSSSSLNNSKAFGLMSNTSIFNNKQTENMKTTEVDEGGFTRDFLGVGSQHRTWPLLMVNRNLLDSSPPATTDGTPTPDRNQ
ncbi:PREDICTED: protein indeterminate-domain 9-like [Camelina sativa]|uniref:Protein indeterminate-domain 9-like n=1 Tax=Camelina sativa TaxID=90675 RepID=A0ABM0TG80_CAMSA|nr:PREDICTED: protein indeterminate-domain 9-like [Camelina sativa]XP_010425953.1 PREDICTED: protein indeterminate-domain 9-like [Camelina sativa]